MDTTKLALALASLASGVVLVLSVFGVIPTDKVESLGVAINQITGAIAGILTMVLPSILTSLKKDDQS